MAKEIDVTNLSFIDLLSCGLGAVLLLLLLFAVSIRTTALRALESEAQAGAQNTPAELQSRGGIEIPPPEALIIELDWGAPTLYPLQLEVEPPMARALTEESPFSGTNDQRYAGFFLRSAVREEDAGGSLLFVLPRFRGLLERLASGGTYSLKGWKVIVKYPNAPSPAAQELEERFLATLSKMREGPWNTDSLAPFGRGSPLDEARDRLYREKAFPAVKKLLALPASKPKTQRREALRLFRELSEETVESGGEERVVRWQDDFDGEAFVSSFGKDVRDLFRVWSAYAATFAGTSVDVPPAIPIGNLTVNAEVLGQGAESWLPVIDAPLAPGLSRVFQPPQ